MVRMEPGLVGGLELGCVLVVHMEPGLVCGLELGVFLWFTWNLGW